MTVTIGRVTLTDDPSEIEYDGDRLVVGGWFFGTTLAQAKVIRQQLLGLDGNDDEPDVPVTWSADADVDGYYHVGSVAVTPVLGVSYERFGFQYSVQLERVQGGFAAPLCEVAATLAVRTNAHAVTAPTGNFCIPQTSTFKRGGYSGSLATFTSGNRVSATGNVDLVSALPAQGSFISFVYATAPADHYDGAVMIEQLVGATWYPVVGDQIGRVSGASLRIGNGLVRFTMGGAAAADMTVEVYDSVVWESATIFRLHIGTSDWGTEGGWRVLRNSPEACTIQSSADIAGSQQRMMVFHLDRGSRLIHVAADGLYSAVGGGATIDQAATFGRSIGTAATAITGGIRQTSNDANGHRWLVLSPSAHTTDLVNGTITIAAPGAPLVAQFAVGFEVNGSSSFGPHTAAAMADAYMAAITTRQRIVAR